MRRRLFRAIQQRLKAFVRAGGASGAQLSLGYKSESFGHFCAGYADQRFKIRMTPSCLFDLSSLTKPISTVWALAVLRTLRRIESFDEPIKLQFSALSSAWKEKSYRDFLEHRAGLPSIFENTDGRFPSREERIKFFLEQVDQLPVPENEASTLYSDVGFMLLGIVIESLFAEDQAEVFRKAYVESEDLGYSLAGLKSSWFRRVRTGHLHIPQRSLDETPRLLQGEVQDPRAQWLGGIAGHAGLFGTSAAVEEWLKEFFMIYQGKGLRLGDKILQELVPLERVTSAQRFVGGFDTPEREALSQAGRLAPPYMVGHLGYTGCSFWMDLEKGWRVVLLTHRHQDGVDPQRLSELRPLLHDWLYEEVFNKLKQL